MSEAVSAPDRIRRRLNLRPGIGAALAGALVLVMLWGVVSAPYFLDELNIFNTLLNMVTVSLLALALAPVIITGEIDVSVQGMISLGAAIGGLLFQHHVPALFVFVIIAVVGGLGGLLNAVLVSRVKLPSLVVTLGTLALFSGLALVTLGQQVVADFPVGLVDFVNSNFLGLIVPTATVLMVVLGLAEALFLHRTVTGRRLFFLGMNSVAARHAGIPVGRYKAAAFLWSGLLSAIAGLVLAVQYASARGDSGAGLLLPALTAVVLGGVDVRGGRGNVMGVLAALFLITAVVNVQTLLGWGPEIGQITIGVLLVVSVTSRGVMSAINRLRRRKEAPASSSSGPPATTSN